MRRAALAAALGASLLAAAPGAQAQPRVCAELSARWEATKADLQTPQISAMLFSASDRGCAGMAETLLAAGALIEAKDRFGNTPLIHAAREGRLTVISALLAHGADINHRNVAGSSALFQAIERKRADAALLLLERGADPNLPGRSGATPLAAAAFTVQANVAAALLKRGANPATPDSTGKPPIVYAAANGSAEIVGALLAAGIDVNARYANDLTVLMWAAGHVDTVPPADGAALAALLLDRGAQVNAADNRGRTALMIAAEQGHAPIVAALIAHGADAAARDKQGKTARDLAANDAVRAALGAG